LVQGVTVTLTRLGESDQLLTEVLQSLAAQTGARGEILFIEQKCDSTISADSFSNERWVCRIVRGPLPGLSAARNLSLKEAAFDQILFCDADAVARQGWAAALQAGLDAADVAIVGSRILPRWSGRPTILARSGVVLDQYSIYDLGTENNEVHRVVGAGFGLDRTKYPAQMFFDENLGRRDGRLFGGEESDLCQRVTAAGGRIMYVGDAVVEHVIPPDRLSALWVAKRLYYAGLGRGNAGGAPSPSRQPGLADWLLLPLILPPYTLGWLWGKLKR
jgi:glycosyltransferase involved in cell wall biosynthesis